MKLIAPDYYPHFHCIASQCRHTCCAGWEIDIDAKTREAYRAVDGPLGDRLRDSIDDDAEGAHFRLGADERCPFLNAEGLCDLIIGLGEEQLCQVCADHPRYRSFLSDRTEIGLGLCCEASSQLILSWKAPVGLLTLEDDGVEEELWDEEREALEARERLLEAAQDRALPVTQRVAEITRMMELENLTDVPMAAWHALFSTLEQLDPGWQQTLELLTQPGKTLGSAWELPFEQLLVYLLYRHVIGAAEDGDLQGRTAFVVISWLVIRQLCAAKNAQRTLTFDAMADIARMYSSEIEYSDENVGAIIEAATKDQ